MVGEAAFVLSTDAILQGLVEGESTTKGSVSGNSVTPSDVPQPLGEQHPSQQFFAEKSERRRGARAGGVELRDAAHASAHQSNPQKWTEGA